MIEDRLKKLEEKCERGKPPNSLYSYDRPAHYFIYRDEWEIVLSAGKTYWEISHIDESGYFVFDAETLDFVKITDLSLAETLQFIKIQKIINEIME